MRFYRQSLKTEFDEKTLRKQVIEQMVEQKLWHQEALRIGLQVTDAELRDTIVKLPGFQQDGQFNGERYRRILSLEKLTSEQFEEQQRKELLIDKAKNLIRQSVALTPSEIKEIEDLNKMNPAASLDQEMKNRIIQKKERTLRAYTQALKQKTAPFINEELL